GDRDELCDRALRQPGGGPARLPQGAGSRRPRPAPDAEQPRDQPSRVRPLLVGPACAEAYAALPSREPAPARGEDWLRQPGDGVPDGPGFLDALVPEPHPGDEADRQAATSRHRLVQPRAAAGLVSVRADRDAGAPRVVDVRRPDRLTPASALAARLRRRLVAPAVDRRTARASHLDVMLLAVSGELGERREWNPVPEMDARRRSVDEPRRPALLEVLECRLDVGARPVLRRIETGRQMRRIEVAHVRRRV